VAVGKPLHLRLFLEGQEVPVISAAVSVNKNAPASAAVQVVPLDKAMELKPRTMVHLFFLDSKVARDADGKVSGGLNEAYKLLFSGEVVGFSTVLTPQSRALILQCLDFSSYWDSAHSLALEFGPGGNAMTNHGSLHGGAVGQVDDVVNFQLDLIANWITQSPLTDGLEHVSGLAGGIIRMMEALGGVPNHHKGINDFFTFAELRARLLSQITAEEKDSTSQRVLGERVFDEWLRTGLQNIGQQVSFRDMMLLLMRYIYYDFVPNPAAMFTPTVRGSRGVRAPSKPKISSAPDAMKAKDLLTQAQSILQNAITHQYGEGGIQNAARAALVDIDGASDLLKTLRTKSKEFAGLGASLVNDLARVQSSLLAVKSTISPATLTALQFVVNKINTSSATVYDPGGSYVIGAKTSRLHSQVFRPDCWYVAPPVCNVIFPEQFSQVSYDRNFMGEVTRVFVSTFVTVVGSDELLNERYYAPQSLLNTRNEEETKKLAQASSTPEEYRLLMDHELHTGIVPRTEWIPNTTAIGSNDPALHRSPAGGRLEWADRIALFHFFKYRYGPRTVNVAGKFNPFVVCGFPGVVIRRPFIVEGGEETIKKIRQGITKEETHSASEILSFIQTNADSFENAPSQFVGLIDSVQHNINQDGGGTVLSLSHARTHLGVDDDFVQKYFAKSSTTSTRTTRMPISYEVVKNSPELLQYLANLTPQGSATSSTTTTPLRKLVQVSVAGKKLSRNPADAGEADFVSTRQVIVDDPVSLTKPDFVMRTNIPAVSRTDVLVPRPHGKLTVGSRGRVGKIIGIEVGDGGNYVTDPQVGRVFTSVTVYEEITINVPLKIPIEQVMRPAWFSDSYTNQRIGKMIYQPFFGCDSIIDAIPVEGVSGFSASGIDPSGDIIDATTPTSRIVQNLADEERVRRTPTIERAVNLIGYLYGQVRRQGLDVDDFISQFNDRPIATLPQMLGENLSFAPTNGKMVPKALDPSLPFTFGFHSAAVHPELVDRGSHIGLLDDPESGLNRIDRTGKVGPLPRRFDVRKAKRDQVTAYVAALQTSAAFRG
jgi:hypothetical protein